MLKADGADSAMAALIPFWALLWLATLGSAAVAGGTECLSQGSQWQPCQWRVEDPGRRWQLQQGNRLWQLQHDGSGVMQLREGSGRWQAVEPHWRQAGELCWGRLCARGEIPLD